MSSGGFLISKYQAGGSATPVVRIRVQPETLTLEVDSVENTPPAGALVAGWPSARVSGGRRGIGLFARMVRIRFTGTPPTGYKAGQTISLPALTPTFYNACEPGKTGTYEVGGNAEAIEVVGRTPEEIR
jgi:hypothetical protein